MAHRRQQGERRQRWPVARRSPNVGEAAWVSASRERSPWLVCVMGPSACAGTASCWALHATCHAHTRLLQGTFRTRIRVAYLRQRRSL